MEAQERFAILKLLLNNEDRVALRWLLGRSHNSWHSQQYGRLLNHVRQTGVSPWTALSSMAAGVLRIQHTAQLVQRFTEIQTEIATLAAAPDLDLFIQQWLPANPATQLLSETVVRARLDATTIPEFFESLYASITQPEVPMEVAEVRVMSLHKSKGLSSPYVFYCGMCRGRASNAS